MNKDDIIRMAREVGLWPSVTDTFPKELQDFAAIVAAAEREECAKVCESAGPGAGQIYCAFAIRARGNDAA
jgi:hypothetical protein